MYSDNRRIGTERRDQHCPDKGRCLCEVMQTACWLLARIQANRGMNGRVRGMSRETHCSYPVTFSGDHRKRCGGPYMIKETGPGQYTPKPGAGGSCGAVIALLVASAFLIGTTAYYYL